MITEIGLTAGDIWQFLDKHGHATFHELCDAIKKDQSLLWMSIGWLAREGHVILSREKDDYHITLRTRE